MPITPKFKLSQTPTHFILDISVPHVRVTEIDVAVEGSTVHFSAAPVYLLRLDVSPHAFVPLTEEECAEYRIEDGSVRVRLCKSLEGMWNDLDLTGRLVQSRPPTTSRWLQSVEGQDTFVDCQSEDSTIQLRTGYGFLRLFHGIFTDITRDGLAQEMFEAPLEESSVTHDDWRDQRRRRRLSVEQTKFSTQRYQQDLDIEDDYLYQCARAMRPHWLQSDDLVKQLDQLTVSDEPFTEDERHELATIPYPLLPATMNDEERSRLLHGLADLLFAYAYDHLLTDGEPNVESAWNMSTLSLSLSWLEELDSVEEVVQASLRRALVYPYLRNLEFGLYVWRHVVAILQRGRRCIIRCLLQMRSVLHHSELYYLGNKLYLDPYLKWMQSTVADDGRFEELASAIAHRLVPDIKSKLELHLDDVDAVLEQHSSDEETSSSDGDSDSLSASSDDSTPIEPTPETASSDLLDCRLGLSSLVIGGSKGELCESGGDEQSGTPLIREIS